MPRDPSNVYTLPEAPFQPNTVAQPAPVNNNFSDIATALTDSLTRAETTPFTRRLLDDADAATARTTLGATTTGDALFTTASAAAARTTLGATVTGGALFTAADAPAARATLGAVNKAGDTMTGDLVISKVSPAVVLAKTSNAEANRIEGRIGTTPQWAIDLGDNDGTDWRLIRYNDSGGAVDFPLLIQRSTGFPVIPSGLRPAWRAAIDAPAIPTNTAGAGEWAQRSSAVGAAVTVPSGGTWAYYLQSVARESGALSQNFAIGVAAGGSTVGAAITGFYWVGLVWRIV